jgi:hypothetical protein
MSDPLDALRLSPRAVDPAPEFTRALLARVQREVDPHPVVLVGGSAERPLAAIGPSTADEDALDQALAYLAGTAPEFDPFRSGFCIANHAPMTAEALCVLGRGDAVMPWIERYGKYLTPTPAGIEPIEPDAWRGALGDYARIGDWIAVFDAELVDASWVDVVNRWLPRLAPGGALGTHGAVRVAHAVRALGRRDNPLRRAELANALAYLAAMYETLPEIHDASAGLQPSQAMRRVEQLDLHDRTGWLIFTQPLEKLRGLPSFAGVADLVDVEGDPSTFLSDLSEAVAALLVSNVATVAPRALVHALTAGAATRMMLPYLSDEVVAVSLRYGWQIAAAFYAGLVLEPAAVDVTPPRESVEELLDEAIACLDEHAIKTLEACLREDAINPNPVYLAAARASTKALERNGLHLR